MPFDGLYDCPVARVNQGNVTHCRGGDQAIIVVLGEEQFGEATELTHRYS